MHLKAVTELVTYSADILSVVCCTSHISSAKIVGVIGWVCDLIGARD